MADSFDSIKRIVDSALGAPKRDYSGSGGWYEYNCPCCADEKGHVDNKYNFAVQIGEEGLWGHCWRCGYHGKLSRVIRDYGSAIDIADYKEELNALRETRFFTLSDSTQSSINDLFDDTTLELPNGFKLIDNDGCGCLSALNYLYKRGVTDDIIAKFNIGYIGAYHGKFSNRIVIPSYDAYGDLNYWVARDYTGENEWVKILNPLVDKKSIVFNEYLINWYEPITLVEGPFDHIVVPNSIPLLGKTLDEECEVYKQVVAKAHSTINIFLDDDAVKDAHKMYRFLNTTLPDRIRFIECPDGYDASDYYRDFGAKGIISLMRNARKLTDFEISMASQKNYENRTGNRRQAVQGL